MRVVGGWSVVIILWRTDIAQLTDSVNDVSGVVQLARDVLPSMTLQLSPKSGCLHRQETCPAQTDRLTDDNSKLGAGSGFQWLHSARTASCKSQVK